MMIGSSNVTWSEPEKIWSVDQRPPVHHHTNIFVMKYSSIQYQS